MENLIWSAMMAMAMLIGGLLAWLLLRSRLVQVQAAIAQKETEIAVLEERLKARDQQFLDMQGAMARLGQESDREIKGLRERQNELTGRVGNLQAELEAERNRYAEQLVLLKEAKNSLADAFKALSAESLRNNNQAFLYLAKESLQVFQEGARNDLEGRQKAIFELVKPLVESLSRMDGKINEIEKARTTAYASLHEQIINLAGTQNQLQQETANLVKALRSPVVRGRWGEMQLKRVVELAGMLEYCDFETQASVTTADGRLRPDMVIRLPNQKNIVVDAKAPLQAYLEALEAKDDEARLVKLREHGRQVRTHLEKLGAKAYWQQFSPAPEFVVLFLPGETFFSAALEQDPSLIEYGVDQQVILATPTTLIALLRAVAYGWRQEKMAEHALRISNYGKDLYDRIQVFTNYLVDVGKGLDRSVAAYNRAIGSLESRVLVSARKFRELGATGGKEIEKPRPLDHLTRPLLQERSDDEEAPSV